ncbi:Thionin-2.2 [Raphanus sativus]|nr:Thionin-2.2 [Raphanus sativus]KAJ4905695.1 Thionin-2.2 [Raphanus sativus]
MAHNQVEARVCCPSKEARLAFYVCNRTKATTTCAQLNGCKIVPETICPSGYPYGHFGNSGNTVNGYCKLGCASSVCSDLATLQDLAASEIVNGAVAQCTNACSDFCTKGSANAVDTA